MRFFIFALFFAFFSFLPENSVFNEFQLIKPVSAKENKENVLAREWKEIPDLKDQNPTIYKNTKNPKFFIVVQEEKPVEKPKDWKKFIELVEEEKAITLSQTAIKDRKVSSSKIKHSKSKGITFISMVKPLLITGCICVTNSQWIV